MIKTPIVIVNFKTYAEATGEKSVKLAKIIASVAAEKGINVAVAPQHSDLYRVASQVDIPVFAQHVDAIVPGKHTGWIVPEAAKEAGAIGSLINHSEHTIGHLQILNTIQRLKSLGMASVACAKDPWSARIIATFEPHVIAIEPPELIGTGRAVSKVKPEIVSEGVKSVRTVSPKVRVLCGAGITSGEDVFIALKLGAEGVLIASSVAKAPDPRAAMLDIAEGILKASKT
jgi:triosephosphate isomerase